MSKKYKKRHIKEALKLYSLEHQLYGPKGANKRFFKRLKEYEAQDD